MTAEAPARPDAATESRCPNCDAPMLSGWAYCAACGQENVPIALTLRDAAREVADDVFSFDAKIFRTLRPLLTRPGELTREYLAGRRTRYVRPLKLYLTVSVLFFLALRLPGVDTPIQVKMTGTADSAAAAAAAPSRAQPPPSADTAARTSARPWQVRGKASRFLRMSSAEQSRILSTAIADYLPNAMWLLVPVYALLLGVLQRRSRRGYLEHLVFALHLHAFVFLLMLAGIGVALLTHQPLIMRLLILWAAVYTFLAMRRVYGQPWQKTLAKFLILGAGYWLVLMLTVAAIAFLGVVRG